MRNYLIEPIIAIARVLLITTGFVIIMALLWDVLDWMRNFGSGLPVIPQLSNQISATTDNHASIIDAVISWHNFTFLGAARFGSALGTFLGVFYALSTLEKFSPQAKFASALIAGLLIGGRLALLLSSQAHIFLFGSITGAIMALVISAILASKKPIEPLPPIDPNKACGYLES
jgi:hypothetical protein